MNGAPLKISSGNYHLPTKKPETSNGSFLEALSMANLTSKVEYLSLCLRAYAGLEKEVVLAGVLDKIEIWDKKAWDAHNEEVEADIDDIAGDMEDLGLRI